MLPKFINSICPNIVNEYPTLFDFNTKVYAGLIKARICDDYFLKSDLCENETPYIDVFPN